MVCSTRQGLFVIDVRVNKVFDTKTFGSVLREYGWLLVWLRPYNELCTVVDWNGQVEKLELNDT